MKISKFLLLAFMFFFTGTLFAQWVQETGPTGEVTVNTLAAKSGYVFAGVYGKGIYRSDDDGNNWVVKNSGLNNLTTKVLFVDGETLVAGTVGGFFFSPDNGENWTANNYGLSDLNVQAIAKFHSLFYIATDAGVYEQCVAGPVSWQEINSGLTNIYVNDFAVKDSFLFAGTYNGVFRKSAGDTVWTSVNTGLPETVTIRSLEIIDSVIYATSSGFVYKSTNMGENWQEVEFADNLDYLRNFTLLNGKLFANSNKGVVYSEDSGESWTVVNSGYPENYPNVNSIASDGSKLFIGTRDGGVYVTDANGENWVGTGPDCNYPAIDELTSAGEYLIARSKNSGFYWKNINNPDWLWMNEKTDCGYANTILFDEGIFYAGSWDGFSKYQPETNTWQAFNQGFSSQADMISVLNIVRLGDSLYVSTQSEGVYSARVDSLVWRKISTPMPDNNGIVSMVALGDSIFALGETSPVLFSDDGLKNWDYAGDTLVTFFAELYVDSGVLYSVGYSGIYSLSNETHKWVDLSFNLKDKWFKSFANHEYGMFASTDSSVFWKANGDTIWTNISGNLPAAEDNSIFSEYPLAVAGGKIYVGSQKNGLWSADISEFYTSVMDDWNYPQSFVLNQNYPNPFNSQTIIKFELPVQTEIKLEVFDILGRRVAVLAEGFRFAGYHSVSFNMKNLPSGMYFYKLTTQGKSISKKMVLLK